MPHRPAVARSLAPSPRFLDPVPVLALAALAAVFGASPALAQGTLYEKLLDVPRERSVAVDLKHEKVEILSVESQRDPKPEEVEEARSKNPKEKSLVLIRFRYNNLDYVSHKCTLRVMLLDEEGKVLAEGGRGSSFDAKTLDDTISFPLTLKTVDWGAAKKMKVLATIY